MNKYLFSFLVLLSISFSSFSQAFEKGGKYYTVGLGDANYFHILANHDFNAIYGFSRYTPNTAQFSFQGEFAVHKYVGVGFTIGVGGKPYFGYGYRSAAYVAEITVPLGFLANFHFYQLIADKSGKKLHSDKLDIYAGLNVGSGVALFPTTKPIQFATLFFAGPQLGLRYYFKPNLAFNVEVGYGKTWLNAGFTFKPKK